VRPNPISCFFNGQFINVDSHFAENFCISGVGLRRLLAKEEKRDLI
jgi:hypothetical protein